MAYLEILPLKKNLHEEQKHIEILKYDQICNVNLLDQVLIYSHLKFLHKVNDKAQHQVGLY